MNWYLGVLKKYATFTGRARRQEFWMFALINFIIVCILSALDMALGIGLLSGIYALAVLLPSLAVGARRLHDIGKTGWLLLLWIIPVIGWVLLIYWAVQPSGPANEYGPAEATPGSPAVMPGPGQQ